MKKIYIGYIKEKELSFEFDILSANVNQSDFLGYWKLNEMSRFKKIGIFGELLTEYHMEKEISSFNIYNPKEKTIYFYSFNYQNVDEWVNKKMFMFKKKVTNNYQKLKKSEYFAE